MADHAKSQTSSCCDDHNHDHTPHSTATDPVCGMSVKLNAGKPSLTYQGEEYHFCNPKCHHKFEADPYFYLSGAKEKKGKGSAKKMPNIHVRWT